jgi:hypothetical protein
MRAHDIDSVKRWANSARCDGTCGFDVAFDEETAGAGCEMNDEAHDASSDLIGTPHLAKQSLHRDTVLGL